MKLSLNLFRVLFLTIFLSTTSCASGQNQDAATNTPPQPESSDKTEHGLSLHKPTAFYTGLYLEGGKFDSSDFAGRKIIFGFFSFEHKNSLPLLKALEKLKPYETEKQFKIFAVSIDYDKSEDVKKFIKDNNVTIPVVIENPALEIATKLKVEHETAVVGLNNKHEAAFGLREYVFATIPNGETQFLDYMKENLSIREAKGVDPFLGLHPQAPDFEATTMDGKKIKLSDYRGKVVLVFFFSPKCPHCHHEIQFLRDSFYTEYRQHGFEILGLSVLALEGDTLTTTQAFKMPWPVIDDHQRKIRNLYSSEMGIPENFFVDKEGKVRYVSRGFATTPQTTNLYTMRVKQLLGLENPPLLSDKKFNGAETCMVCHEAQYASWSVTPHAHAWETLQIKGEDFNPECVGCHSIGMNDPKGWSPMKHPKTGEQVANVPPAFQNVQCEHCHGIGGKHLSKPLQGDELKKTCLECHTDKFSLHFDFDERLKKVGHGNASQIMAMSEAERVALLKKVSKKPDELFGAKVKYVGSSSCISCHADIHKNWGASVHAKAFETLKSKNQHEDPECLQCHTVGYGQSGGYQESLNKDFEGVGCESCHGPGEKHVQTKKKTDIRGLGADCPFCVIEQICMSCHDAKNDADFNLVKDLEKIKGHR